MNERTELLTTNYKPILAVTVYRTSDNISGEGKYYLESHDINTEGQIMQGKPLLQETMHGIVDVFFDERKDMAKITGMIPENLLSFSYMPGGNYQMSWYRPAEIRVLHFAAQLKIDTGKAWVPAMIYKVQNNGLDVFALKTNTRPKENTKLSYAPFFNVNETGDVCLGSAKVKVPVAKTYENLTKYWEDLFWLSEFTHVNGEDEKTTTKLQPLWKKLMKSKCRQKWSEINELRQYKNLTLKEILK